jgi:hypothetical protein
MRHSRIAAAGASAAVLVGLIPLVAGSGIANAAVAPVAPKGVAVARDTSAVNDLVITWKPVDGVDHYMVRVNDGPKDTNYIVAKDATTFTHHGAGACTRYKVWVSAVAADGTMATTDYTFVNSLAPGVVTSVRGLRTELGSVATVSWGAPANSGFAPIKGYSVVVTQMSTGKKVVSRDSADGTEQVTGLDPKTMYSAKITAHNAYGSCSTGTFVVGSNRPAAPAFTVSRDPADAAKSMLTWSMPAWQGYGPVTTFLVGYKNVTSKSFTWVKADAKARSVAVPKLDPTVNWQFVLRAMSSDDVGLLSRVVVLRRSGYKPVNASVVVSSDSSTIDVTFSSPVGSSTNYPKAKVTVGRANGTTGWTDTHTVTNGAGLVHFTPVPCGTYAITVTGFSGTAAQEMVRTTARVCDLPKECFVSTLQNGNFETPVLPAKSYRIMSSATPGVAWNNTAEPFVEMWSTGFGGVPAAEGNQFAELNANKAGTLYQDLPTVPGTTMRWYLNHRGRTGVDTMRVLIGKPGATLAQSGANLVDDKTAWGLHTGTYTIPAGQTVTRFAFQAVNAGSFGNFLDDVVFTPEACQ